MPRRSQGAEGAVPGQVTAFIRALRLPKPASVRCPFPDPVQEPGRYPDGQAQYHGTDHDRDRPKQPCNNRGGDRDSTKRDPRRPGRAPVLQAPQPPAPQRQRQAARDHREQRYRHHEKLGRGRFSGPLHEADHRRSDNPGRQPQQGEQPEAALPDHSPVPVHGFPVPAQRGREALCPRRAGCVRPDMPDFTAAPSSRAAAVPRTGCASVPGTWQPFGARCRCPVPAGSPPACHPTAHCPAPRPRSGA